MERVKKGKKREGDREERHRTRRRVNSVLVEANEAEPKKRESK